jgi:anti-sigma regulatory factor (Ser/Thr protein kinase)
VPDLDAARHDPLKPGGLGLPCMKQLMGSVEFVPQADGMLLRMYRAADVSNRRAAARKTGR